MAPRSTLLFLCLSICVVKGADPDPYLAAGVPATDRIWNGDDYVTAQKIFASGQVALPRFSDPHGAAVLQRMFGQRDFSLYYDKGAPLMGRMGEGLNLIMAVGGIGKLYNSALAENQIVHEEYANFSAFSLYAVAMELDLVDEFLPTIPHDADYPSRMQGLQTMKNGLTEMVVGFTTTLGDPKFYSTADRSLVLHALADTLPKLKKAFTPSFATETNLKLESFRPLFTDKADLALLDKAEAELAKP